MTTDKKADDTDATASARRDVWEPIAAPDRAVPERRRRARTALASHVGTTRQRRCAHCGCVDGHHADCEYEKFTADRRGAVNPWPE